MTVASWRTVRSAIAVLTFAIPEMAIADKSIWTELSAARAESASQASGRTAPALSGRHFKVNRDGLDALIRKGLSSSNATFTLDLPLPDSGFQQFNFRLSGTMSQGLAEKFPNIRAFSGTSKDKAAANAQMEVTPLGVSVQVLASEGRWVIESSDPPNPAHVKSYFTRYARRSETPFQCGVTDHEHKVNGLQHGRGQTNALRRVGSAKLLRSRGTELRTYRLAVATTGEYSEYHGGSVESVLSAVVKVVNRVNGIFNSEISVGFELVENNEEIIFIDAETDPFEGNSDTSILIDESQTVIDEVIGSGNYDIGHTFASDGGGLASTGPCQEGYKASGVTGGTEGDAFAVDYVAHEIGHQFGMDHTFNTNSDDCVENRVAKAAYEPGTGSTIMSYNGVCSADNILQQHLQNNNSDPIFHSFSFEQAVDYIDQEGAACGVVSETANSRPDVDAGGHYTVPARTAMYLEGAGSDADGQTINYSWEQRDLGPAAALAAPDDGSIPLFRTYAPISSASRYLPRLQSVVSGIFEDTEKVPSKPRTMVFALTARDGVGGRNSDTTEIKVIAQPLKGKIFSVAEPNQGGALGKGGTVRWHVGETDKAPVSAAELELYLSTDSGQTFPEMPFTTVPNDGYARVEFPSGIRTDSARIMIKARDNIFFEVSDSDFSIDTDLPATPEVPAPENVSSASSGDSEIKISFSPQAQGAVTYYDATCVGEGSSTPFTASATPDESFDDTQLVSSSLTLQEAGLISPDGLTVTVDISHSYRGDVVIKLISPSGVISELKGPDVTDSSDDIQRNYIVSSVSGEPVSGDWHLQVSDRYEGDDGRLVSWSLTGTAVQTSRTVQASISPSLQFDDTNPITSRLELAAKGTVSPDEFEVEVDISHTWRSDVVIELETPSGKRITLRRVAAEDSGDNVKGAYPTNLSALTPFSELAGEALSGAWILHVSDQYAGDEGVLNSWGITQRQYVFNTSGTKSPVVIMGLPSGETYDCSIASVYSEVTPFRQSMTVKAGNVELKAPTVTSNAEATFLNLLQTLVGLNPSGGPNDNVPQARQPESGGKEDAQIKKPDSALPKMIPTTNLWTLTSLVLLTAFFGFISLKSREARH